MHLARHVTTDLMAALALIRNNLLVIKLHDNVFESEEAGDFESPYQSLLPDDRAAVKPKVGFDKLDILVFRPFTHSANSYRAHPMRQLTLRHWGHYLNSPGVMTDFLAQTEPVLASLKWYQHNQWYIALPQDRSSSDASLK